jgi:tripartite-type tricarboxylate transporter receptor subunit TctC
VKRGYCVLLMVLGVNLAHVFAAAGALAQYPNKPVRFILPFPGGATDFLGRVVGQKLAEALGQPVVIDNRPGAGGNLGIEIAARSAPDGYTLVLVAPNITISPSLYRKLNYDPVKDFAPVTPVATVTMVIVTRPALPAQTLKEFIALAKSKPGQLNYGSGGSGTSLHLAGELFKITAGVDLVHVPYKGASLAMNDVIGGRLDSLFIGIPAPAPHVKAGRLRGLAVLASQRSPVLPEVPTATEAGLPGFQVSTWYGVLAPAGTPKDIVARLNHEIVKIMNTPDTIERLAVVAADPMTSSPEQFATYINQEIARWSKVVRTAGLRAD